MDLAVGDGDGAGEAGARNIGQSSVDRGKEAGAGVAAFRHGDGAQFQVRQFGGLLGDGGAGGFGQSGAVADLHRGGAVHHQKADIRQRLSCFLHQARAGEPEQQHGEGGESQDGAAGAAPGGEGDDQQGDEAEDGDEPDRQQRVEAERGDGLFGVHGAL